MMSNRQSGISSAETSSPQSSATDSRDIVHSAFTTNSANTNSFNTTNTTNHYHGDPNPPDDYGEILQCLYTSAYLSHRNRVREPVEGTCNWVTEHPKFKDWLGKKASGLLWLSADPGCGKSVIASFLSHHLTIRTNAIVCYFFFKDDSAEQKSATFALCAILHQLFFQKEDLCKYAAKEFKAKGKKFAEELDTLWNILLKAVAEGGCGQVICVLDALDECEEMTLAPLIHHVATLPGLPQTSETPLKFLVTARPYHRIERDLCTPATTIRLRGEEEVNVITADVNLVIDEGIRNLESCWEQPGKLGYLRDLLKSSADRTFLWVSLVLEVLKNSEDDSVEEFTKIVSSAPCSIAELYTRILDKSRYPDKARKILKIVVAAVRPLTLREMHAAFRIERDHKSVGDLGGLPASFERLVKNWCGLFIRVIDSKIYLVHQTAREFLIGGSSLSQGNWQYTLCPNESNFLLADICISYLSLEDFENDPLVIKSFYDYTNANGESYIGYLQKYSLLDYAATHWAEHFRDSGSQQMELFKFTRLICESGSKRFLTWLKVHWVNNHRYYEFPDDGFTHLMIASWFGQGMMVEQLLQEGVDIDARSKMYGTALNIAATRKQKDVAAMLVERSANAVFYGKWYNIINTKRSELHGLLEEIEDEIDFLLPFCIQDIPDPHRIPSEGTSF